MHFVCLVCGYNMVDRHPERCPFCGADQYRFITAEECSKRFRVIKIPVTEEVARLNSSPALGMEHAGYRIEADGRVLWVDCPSTYSAEMDPPDLITFTHHHFLGASMLYRALGGARTQIHRRDSDNGLTVGYVFHRLFEDSFSEGGLTAHFINGHTWGFTFYIFENVLFTCDYVFKKGEALALNPFGDPSATWQGALKMRALIDGLDLEKVCAYNYVEDYGPWREKFDRLLDREPDAP